MFHFIFALFFCQSSLLRTVILLQNELCFSGPPAPIINSSISHSSKEIRLNWFTTCSSCGQDRIANFYEVLFRVSEMAKQSNLVVGRNSQFATISDLSPNTLYTVAVRIISATTSSGKAFIGSDRSAEAQVATGDILRFKTL